MNPFQVLLTYYEHFYSVNRRSPTTIELMSFYDMCPDNLCSESGAVDAGEMALHVNKLAEQGLLEKGLKNLTLPPPKSRSGKPITAIEIDEIVSRPSFVRALKQRGVVVTTTGAVERASKLSTNQIYAALAVCNGDGGSLEKRLAAVDVSVTTWHNWMRDPVFSSYVNGLGNHAVVDAIPVAKTALAERMIAGDLNATRYAFEMTGEYDPRSRDAVNVSMLMARVFEVISKNVNDPMTLMNIANGLKQIEAAGDSSATRLAGPRNIELDL